MGQAFHALSLKQPWAALVVRGVKTIEVRTWPTDRHGLILIHAARLIDERRAAWNLVSDEVEPNTQYRGGIIGAVEVADCITYDCRAAFALDQSKHLVPPAWFVEPATFGFVLKNPRTLPFQRVRGWFRFFTVEWKGKEALG